MHKNVLIAKSDFFQTRLEATKIHETYRLSVARLMLSQSEARGV